MDRCLFCSEDRPLTQEHLISKPIKQAFQLDGKASVAELSYPPANPDDPDVRSVALRKMTVGIACAECNNGWLSDLENAAAAAFDAWLRDGRLEADGYDSVSRWLATRLHVWSLRDGRWRDLEQAIERGEGAVIPNFNRAGRLAAGAEDATEGLVTGAARSDGSVGYGFGNARTHPNGIRKPFTAVLALSLPPLQLWVADSQFESDIRLPTGVIKLRSGSPLRRLQGRGGNLSPDLVQVTFRD